MGTRRLRLYVAAYLRGLLTPYYEQGSLSVVREEMILDALSAEMDRDMDKQLLLVRHKMADYVKDKKDYFKKLYDFIYEFRYKLEYDKTADSKPVTDEERLTIDPEIHRLISTYKEMERTGELEKTRKLAEDLHKDTLHRRMQGASMSQHTPAKA